MGKILINNLDKPATFIATTTSDGTIKLIPFKQRNITAVKDTVEIKGKKPYLHIYSSSLLAETSIAKTIAQEYPIITIKPEDIETKDGYNNISSQLSSTLDKTPEASAIIGLVQYNDYTKLIIASRKDAITKSRLEGIHGVIQKLANSPSIKKLLTGSHGTSALSSEDSHSNSKISKLSITGKLSPESLTTALIEGTNLNQTGLLKDLINNLPKGERVLLLIGGPSNAGKSTIINEIQQIAKDRQVSPFPGDMYFRDADDPLLPKTETGTAYWDNPDAIHLDAMSNDISSLIKNGKVEIPIYNFAKQKPGIPGNGYREEQKAPLELGKNDILAIDSLHAMNPKLLKTFKDTGLQYICLYLDSSSVEDRLQRRIVRDFYQRGREPEQTLADWDATTFPGEVNYVRPTILALDVAHDLFLTRKFPTDLGLSRNEINTKVQLFKDYGIQPSHEAFAVSNNNMAQFVLKEVEKFKNILNNPASKPEEKQSAEKGLERLCKAKKSVIKDHELIEGGAAANVNLASMVQKPTLKELLPENPSFIPAEKVKEIKEKLNISTEELLQQLIPVAKTLAKPPISQFFVGAAGLGKSGNIYLGANMEFSGLPLVMTTHAEQFVVANAKNHDEEGLLSLAVSAAPCGHCRQFLNELGNNKELQIIIPGKSPTPLAAFLPDDFGPGDLGVKGALLSPQSNNLHLKIDPLELAAIPDEKAELLEAALKAVNASYSPPEYTKLTQPENPFINCPSGVAVRTKDGKIFKGSYLANAAYNPGMLPLQQAFTSLIADRKNFSDIEKVVLLEKENVPIKQEKIAKLLLETVAPQASFAVCHVK